MHPRADTMHCEPQEAVSNRTSHPLAQLGLWRRTLQKQSDYVLNNVGLPMLGIAENVSKYETQSKAIKQFRSNISSSRMNTNTPFSPAFTYSKTIRRLDANSGPLPFTNGDNDS